jgi:hypothetical protein
MQITELCCPTITGRLPWYAILSISSRNANEREHVSKPLFALLIDAQVDICGGPDTGTEYSLENACRKCGTGARQVGPLHLARFRLPKTQMFKTLDDEVLVQGDLADALRAHGVTSLGEVRDAKSQTPLKLLQLSPEADLPPFSPETTGVVRERPCPVCMRDGYFGIPHVPYAFHYSTLDERLASKDVLATYERFGNSALREPFSDSVFAAAVLIVGPRVAAALAAAKTKNVELLPVRVLS